MTFYCISCVRCYGFVGDIRPIFHQNKDTCLGCKNYTYNVIGWISLAKEVSNIKKDAKASHSKYGISNS
jgi:hypothetical protein